MNDYVKKYFHRGLIFGGFGPMVLGIVYLVIDLSMAGIHLSGWEILLGILSTYILAFVQAGSTVFNQIEGWPIAKSLGIHFISLYLVYVLAYIANTWIPFDPIVILIFTGIFVAVYFIIWITVYICVRSTSKRLNGKLS
ncbi:MAG: DUF3021 domain-containing protein [Clostridia bacterium]|nr:DUF3021 domain-containing protein [Clostridia bacterium]